jgi:MarR family transcriptional regulator, organic hydroperoxide resistance regulator
MRGETPRGAGHEQLEQDAVGPLTVSNDALLVNGSDSQFREIVHNFLAFSARLEQIRSRFGAYIGLSGVQYTILMTIRQLQGRDGVGIRAIADHLAFSPPFVTNETTRLVKRGLVNKARHPDDARRVRLTVSSDGTALLSRLAPLQREINNVLFAPITPENFHAVRAMAQALRNSSQEAVLLSDYLIGRGDTDEYDNNSGEGNPG